MSCTATTTYPAKLLDDTKPQVESWVSANYTLLEARRQERMLDRYLESAIRIANNKLRWRLVSAAPADSEAQNLSVDEVVEPETIAPGAEGQLQHDHHGGTVRNTLNKQSNVTIVRNGLVRDMFSGSSGGSISLNSFSVDAEGFVVENLEAEWPHSVVQVEYVASFSTWAPSRADAGSDKVVETDEAQCLVEIELDGRVKLLEV